MESKMYIFVKKLRSRKNFQSNVYNKACIKPCLLLSIYHYRKQSSKRTFLLWLRTNLGIMAFGFFVERVSFFRRINTATCNLTRVFFSIWYVLGGCWSYTLPSFCVFKFKKQRDGLTTISISPQLSLMLCWPYSFFLQVPFNHLFNECTCGINFNGSLLIAALMACHPV